MALEFVQDAICLSGLTGSKLKCDVIGAPEAKSGWFLQRVTGFLL